MAITRQGGPGIGLDTKPMLGNNNVVSLAAGETYVLPAGQFYITQGAYTFLQTLDPITGRWRAPSSNPNTMTFVTADGANVRLANLTGCAIGGYITNVGSGYTSAPTVTASAGGSLWTAIVGGAINATVTITTAGVGYNFAPMLVLTAPPPGGIQATAVATVSGGAITGVTVVNQGAGYVTAPTITVIADPRDTPSTTAVLTVNATLAGAGTITGLLCTNHGSPQTAVPTLAFAGGGGSAAAATAVMCFTATGATVVAAGVAYGTSLPAAIITVGGTVAGAAGATVNPFLDRGLLLPRQSVMTFTSSAGGAITGLTGLTVIDGGLFEAVPTGIVISGAAIPTTIGTVTINVGGTTDTSYVQPY